MKSDASHALLDQAQELGYEARTAQSDHATLKVWLRMLACTTQVESEIRRRLRAQFGMSLARFDYLAQLHRHPHGLKMNQISSFLMVTGGNITGLTDELERDELVERRSDPADRRAWRVCLTAKGRGSFEAMAQEHENWILEMFGGLGGETTAQLYQTLGQLRVHLLQRDRNEEHDR